MPSKRPRALPKKSEGTRISFLPNPTKDLNAELSSLAREFSGGEATIVVAWINEAGCALLKKCMRPSIVKLRLIVGINRGGTSGKALRAALKVADELYYFYDSPALDALIFHPKVYLMSQHHRDAAIVGSSNATPGGLLDNTEASIVLDNGGDKSSPVSEPIREIRSWIDNLLSDQDHLTRVDEAGIRKLVATRVIPERSPTQRNGRGDGRPVFRAKNPRYPRRQGRPSRGLVGRAEDVGPSTGYVRYTRRVGTSEANRANRILASSDGVGSGTLEINLELDTGIGAECDFWAWPSAFSTRRSGAARERYCKTLVISRRGSAKYDQARIWARLRGASRRLTEFRFHFASNQIIRDIFPRLTSSALVTITRNSNPDVGVDFVVRIVTPDDSDHATLQPSSRAFAYSYD